MALLMGGGKLVVLVAALVFSVDSYRRESGDPANHTDEPQPMVELGCKLSNEVGYPDEAQSVVDWLKLVIEETTEKSKQIRKQIKEARKTKDGQKVKELTVLRRECQKKRAELNEELEGDGRDTLLKKYFCGVFWLRDHISQGLPPCEDVKAAVVSKLDGPLPTLELGDEAKPGLFFVHGWPDNAAVFATMFAEFCFGETATHRCVAVTLQNFHPDLPDYPEEDLAFSKTQELVVASVEAANMVDPTFVIHAEGSTLGYHIMASYPALFKRTISLDLGTGGSPDLTYRDLNAQAYKDKDTPLAKNVARGLSCGECPRWQSSWLFANNLGGMREELDRGTMGEIVMPRDKPLLFVYGTENGRGGDRPEGGIFYNQTWLDFVETTPHGKVVPTPGSRWMFLSEPKYTFAKVREWLDSLG